MQLIQLLKLCNYILNRLGLPMNTIQPYVTLYGAKLQHPAVIQVISSQFTILTTSFNNGSASLYGVAYAQGTQGLSNQDAFLLFFLMMH